MKHSKLILIITLFIITNSLAQENFVKHTVQKGETITSIANKYHVDPSIIYEINPDCSRKLKLQSVLLIPGQNSNELQKKNEIKPVVDQTTHEVQSKETLFSIAKQYQISIDELNDANPQLREKGLKAGQKISIPVKDNSTNGLTLAKEETKTENQKNLYQKEKPTTDIPQIAIKPLNGSQMHEVLEAETKFGIAKKYGISIADLDKANPILEKEALKVGQKITIPIKTESITIVSKVVETEISQPKVVEKEKTEIVATSKELNSTIENETLIHTVLPKETKYGIAKKYGITVTELEKQNPAVAKNLFVGAKLTIIRIKEIQGTTSIEKEEITTTIEENSSNTETNTIASSVAKWNTKEELAEALINMARENLGSRYRIGGISKNGFDCSGLMCSTFGSLDIKLPRSSFEQSAIGTVVSMEEAQKGDLIFFKTNGRNQINHVGMVVEVCDGEIKFIHSSIQKGVIISSTKEKYYEKKISQINRVLQQ